MESAVVHRLDSPLAMPSPSCGWNDRKQIAHRLPNRHSTLRRRCRGAGVESAVVKRMDSTLDECKLVDGWNGPSYFSFDDFHFTDDAIRND